MDQRRYIGPIADLQGKTALVREYSGQALAQFDGMGLVVDGRHLCRDWHPFRPDEFEPIGEDE